MSNRFNQIRREEMKQKCMEHLGGKKCKKCGDQGLHACCYDFHHVGMKTDNISVMISKRIDFEDIKKELEHCVLVCANCHRFIHHMNEKIRK